MQDRNPAYYELAAAHWKAHRKAGFPHTLRGRVVNGHPVDVLAHRVRRCLSEIFEHGRPASSLPDIREMQAELAGVASALEGDEWQYCWSLAEMARLVSCIPEDRGITIPV